MGIEALRSAIDDLVADGALVHSDGESVVALSRQLSRLEAFVTAATDEFSRSGEAAADGARSAKAWLVGKTRLPKAAVGRGLRLGRGLRELPVAGEAWLAGEIDGAHLSQLLALKSPRTEAYLARDEAMLVGFAREQRFDDFSRSLAHWRLHADPDGAEQSAADQHASRAVLLNESIGGMWFGDMALDPISGTIVANEMGRIERRMFEEDWAKAKAELGHDPRPVELGRTAAQRRADAMVEMAIRSATMPETGQRPRPLFTVLVGYETLLGTISRLEGGPVVAPGFALQWLAEADIERVVFDSAGRPIEVGARQRLFRGAKRRALEVRDQGCFHWSCDEPPNRCQGDHYPQRYTDDGPTLIDNGRLACGFHNRASESDPERGPPEPDS